MATSQKERMTLLTVPHPSAMHLLRNAVDSKDGDPETRLTGMGCKMCKLLRIWKGYEHNRARTVGVYYRVLYVTPPGASKFLLYRIINTKTSNSGDARA
ncbi:hypothetical protein PISMIDRAFT_671745 [Pisolithus microcarpus 441]|uniref:Uncharacterized protein n=1 Tax=Pisolithus microcarpus 441 TaxID=765257 RepID=A0A0D0ACH1_9AGAM|nr:hypothetical protein PISMIDRAFT_671745 [Pisolithus microcarpus 441]